MNYRNVLVTFAVAKVTLKIFFPKSCMEHSAWFVEWFNSPYYHILYQNRTDTEAHVFMSHLAEYLHIAPRAKILDAACGKGRHSAFLSMQGFEVTGFDLAPESIDSAKKNYENISKTADGRSILSFFVHDIRQPFRIGYFDYVLNLFTSFGYFPTHAQNQKAVYALSQNLRKEGILVIDFLNTDKILKHLPKKEEKSIDNVHFFIEKYLSQNIIVKDIRFENLGNQYKFQERVMAIKEADFKAYFESAQLKIVKCFGDYQLTEFDPANSDRMIWVLQK